MKLHNKTLYNYKAVINGREFDFKKDATIELEHTKNTRIQLKCLEKSSVHLDWLSIIFLHYFFGSTTLTNIYTDYSFEIENDINETIEIKYNDWCPREQINIKSCFADADVINEEYTLPQLDRVKKKHLLLHLFVSSAPLLGIACLVLVFLTDPPALFIVLFFIWLLMFEIPGHKEIKRFKQVMKPEYLNEKMCEYAVKSRAQGVTFKEDTSKTGKFMNKIIGKMFKFDEDKK
ncbi:MAG: hypothetical protein ACI4IR_03830 [Eubacterium sp.]